MVWNKKDTTHGWLNTCFVRLDDISAVVFIASYPETIHISCAMPKCQMFLLYPVALWDYKTCFVIM